MIISYGIYFIIALVFFFIGVISNKTSWREAIICPIADIIRKAIPSQFMEKQVADFLIELGKAIKNNKK